MTRLRVRPQAKADIAAAADYYSRSADLELGERFVRAVEQAQQRLLEHPRLGPEVRTFRPALIGLRFWPVPGFERHLIHYFASDETLDIVRMLDGSRDLADLLGVDDADA